MKKEILIIYETLKELTDLKNAFAHLQEEFNFYYAPGAKEGLSRVKTKAIDIVFCKYHLPKKTGLFFLAVIRGYNKFRKLRIYLYGDDICREESEMARLLGATGCFNLEEDVNVLVHQLTALLNPQLIPGYIFLTRRITADFSKIMGLADSIDNSQPPCAEINGCIPPGGNQKDSNSTATQFYEGEKRSA